MSESAKISTPDLEWTVHIARRDPLKAAAVFIFISALSLFSGLVLSSVFFSFFAFAVLLISLMSYFFPVYYRLDTEGVGIRILFHRRQRPWADFKRWETDGKSIKLMTMKTRSRLENYRGWLIHTEADKREKILNYIREHID